MDYFIDNMLKSSGKPRSRSVPPSPEPPRPPTPTLSRKKRTKTVKSPEGSSSGMVESSNLAEAPAAAAAATVPLPETPAQSTAPVPTNDKPPHESTLSANAPPEAVTGEPDYFSAADLAPPETASVRPTLKDQPNVAGSAYFSTASELPPATTELPQGPSIVVEHVDEPQPPAVVEEQDPIAPPKNAEAEAKVEIEAGEAVEEVPRDHDGSPLPMLHVASMPIPTVHDHPALLIGISGCPSSGKTTIAHLLSLILPPTTPPFIVHQDDFLVPDHLLVPDTSKRQGINYRHTVDFSALKRLLDYAKREGRLPPAFKSLQPGDSRERAIPQVSSDTVEEMQSSLAGLPFFQCDRSVGIVEGSLLYHSDTIRDLLDIKILLRASKGTSSVRRSEKLSNPDLTPDHTKTFRHTMDYFNLVDWRSHAKQHAVLFEDGNIEGRPVQSICEGTGIIVQPTLDMSIEETLRWSTDVVRNGCHEAAGPRNRKMSSDVGWPDGYEHCRCDEGVLGKIRQAIFDFI
ncbi:MAG: hypothetical protein Q9222_007424 [Ikaeria aurantiellina]